MDVIKKKMQAMKIEKDNAMDRCDSCEEQCKTAKARVEKAEEEVEELVKKSQQLEAELEVTNDKLETATSRLEEREKAFIGAESDVNTLNRKVQILEEDLEKNEERWRDAYQKLVAARDAADEGAIIRTQLETKSVTDEEKFEMLEHHLKFSRNQFEEADKKYEELVEKLRQSEGSLENAEEQIKIGETKMLELEEELRVVGGNLKSLVVSEDKWNQMEETYKDQIQTITSKLKQAEGRAEFADVSVKKLQKEVDRLEDELVGEQEKFKAISVELDQTFSEMSGY